MLRKETIQILNFTTNYFQIYEFQPEINIMFRICNIRFLTRKHVLEIHLILKYDVNIDAIYMLSMLSLINLSCEGC